jgi:hypothetical protein
LLLQSCEVRHFPVGYELCEQIRIKPINPEDDHFSGCDRSATRAATGAKQQERCGTGSEQAQQDETFSETRGHCP